MPCQQPPYRVIQWGTGAVGKYCIQRTLELADLKQAGALVFSDDKHGTDVGVIAGRGAIGVRATKDKDSIYRTDADVVLYTPLVIDHDDVCAILASGKNLITPCGMVFLKDKTLLARINDACAKGGSTMFATGVYPGFTGDCIPLMLSAMCRRIDKITVYELLDMTEITQSADLIFGYLGFNMDAATAAKQPPAMIDIMRQLFEESMHMLASGLGFKIDRFRTSHAYALTLEDSPTTPGLIKKGHVGGQHFRYEAMVGERTLIDFQLYWRMAKKLTPVWDQPMTGLTYVVEITGDPSMRCVVEPVGERPAELGVIATAALVMNAIPEVCRAAPGFKTILDMPLITAKSAVHT
jgi:hypothetical protein